MKASSADLSILNPVRGREEASQESDVTKLKLRSFQLDIEEYRATIRALLSQKGKAPQAATPQLMPAKGKGTESKDPVAQAALDLELDQSTELLHMTFATDSLSSLIIESIMNQILEIKHYSETFAFNHGMAIAKACEEIREMNMQLLRELDDAKLGYKQRLKEMEEYCSQAKRVVTQRDVAYEELNADLCQKKGELIRTQETLNAQI
ncbi:hypothetical protein GH714_033462 [Hevea brasiliensis]|uniref:Uncharacterized protein n=1 Tax=Hevea brasiliensis TaxID=3981 RepID=A0A6A6LY23_HEVBR|nr:hypothetical protein GH714_033462 [Hevea brasiliensis]